jgi:ATP-dependent Zn protease
MIRRSLPTALVASCLALALYSASALAAPPPVTESFSTFKAQVAAGQVRDAVFNKKAHTAHIVLKNLQRQEISYPSHQFAQLSAELKAKGAHVVVKGSASKAKPVHHKLRYIAGAIVIVALIGIGVLLLLRRRRYQAMGGGGAGAVPLGGSGGPAPLEPEPEPEPQPEPAAGAPRSDGGN